MSGEPVETTGYDIAAHQILVALAAHDHAGVPVPAEDHRRARHAVVVVGHRIAVGAGRGRHDDVARPRIRQRDVAHDHVAGLAVLAREVADLAFAVASMRLAMAAS